MYTPQITKPLSLPVRVHVVDGWWDAGHGLLAHGQVARRGRLRRQCHHGPVLRGKDKG